MRAAQRWDIVAAECAAQDSPIRAAVNSTTTGSLWRWTVFVPTYLHPSGHYTGLALSYQAATSTADNIIAALSSAISAMTTPCPACHAATFPPPSIPGCHTCDNPPASNP